MDGFVKLIGDDAEANASCYACQSCQASNPCQTCQACQSCYAGC